MKKKLLIVSIGVIVIMAILAKLWTGGSYVKLEKIRDIEMDITFKGDYWHMVDENRIDYLKFYNLNSLDFDLASYNIVISEGREIIEMKYKREKTFPFKQTKFTKTVLGAELYQNKIFIYRVDKKDKVYLDERGSNMDIQIRK
jgi:hypothetical protein